MDSILPRRLIIRAHSGIVMGAVMRRIVIQIFPEPLEIWLC